MYLHRAWSKSGLTKKADLSPRSGAKTEPRRQNCQPRMRTHCVNRRWLRRFVRLRHKLTIYTSSCATLSSPYFCESFSMSYHCQVSNAHLCRGQSEMRRKTDRLEQV